MNARRAFSMTELLVVCAIIGLLAALMQPVLKKAVWSAKTSAAVSQMGQLTKAFMLYREDWSNEGGGLASGLGLPTVEMSLVGWNLWDSLGPTASPLLNSPCGTHPGQPHSEKMNLTYYPSDDDEVSRWGSWYEEVGEKAVFIVDVNCVDHIFPLHNGFFTHTLIGGRLDGGVARRHDRDDSVVITAWRKHLQ